ncbi:unnamed protein product [Diplocarpon coronariae]|uniref:Uncharacterized protein n=1 Tax=Diplocarpon coronariae TaxID=2795749 RepID=A0A218YUB0_9HELO|nr:hypothetical protein B2J93_2271 [Marssonina coronariae]
MDSQTRSESEKPPDEPQVKLADVYHHFRYQISPSQWKKYLQEIKEDLLHETMDANTLAVVQNMDAEVFAYLKELGRRFLAGQIARNDWLAENAICLALIRRLKPEIVQLQDRMVDRKKRLKRCQDHFVDVDIRPERWECVIWQNRGKDNGREILSREEFKWSPIVFEDEDEGEDEEEAEEELNEKATEVVHHQDLGRPSERQRKGGE